MSDPSFDEWVRSQPAQVQELGISELIVRYLTPDEPAEPTETWTPMQAVAQRVYDNARFLGRDVSMSDALFITEGQQDAEILVQRGARVHFADSEFDLIENAALQKRLEEVEEKRSAVIETARIVIEGQANWRKRALAAEAKATALEASLQQIARGGYHGASFIARAELNKGGSQ